MRRVALWSLLLGLLGPLAGLALLRPASAAPPAFARYALTVTGAGLTGAGTVAASGGLILTDQGTATVSGRIDEAPSAEALAVAAEPGSTYRTLTGAEDVSSANAPQAHALYPGGDPTESDTTFGSESATVTPTSAAGDATSDSGATATERLAADVGRQTLSATASVGSGDITVAGALLIHSVVGTAAITRTDGVSKPTASISPVSASIGGVPFTIDSSGVHSPTPVDAPLAAAGISISTLAPVTSTSATGSLADSGGVVVHIVQPDTGLLGTAGASTGFDVSLLLGRVVVTESHAPALSIPEEAVPSTTRSPAPKASRTATVVVPPSSAPTTVTPPVTEVVPPPVVTPTTTAPGPEVAVPAPAASKPSEVSLLGHRVRVQAVLAGLGAWQLLTLGSAAGAVLLGRGDEDPEEHLCPC